MQIVSRAFTLIELLVVIAIISVLASMLLPAVSMVRESAQTSVCSSNQRQIATAVLQYAREKDDLLPWSLIQTPAVMPPALVKYGITTIATWMHTPLVGQYLEIEGVTGNVEGMKGSLKALVCPRNTQNGTSSSMYPGYTAFGTTYPLSYGLNGWLCPRLVSEPNPASKVNGTRIQDFRMLMSIKDKSRRVLVTDVAGDPSWTPSIAPTTDYALPPCPVYDPLTEVSSTGVNMDAGNGAWRWVPRHRGKAVAAFLDGHVETLNIAVENAKGNILTGRP